MKCWGCATSLQETDEVSGKFYWVTGDTEEASGKSYWVGNPTELQETHTKHQGSSILLQNACLKYHDDIFGYKRHT